MTLHALIGPKAINGVQKSTELSRAIEATGSDYDTAKAGLVEQVPDGWVLLHIRQA